MEKALYTTEEVKTTDGSLVKVFSFRGELIDTIKVSKFSGLKVCETTNGDFGTRFQNAVNKAKKIFEKCNS